MTRAVAAIVVPVLLPAFVIMYLDPDSSGERFAWVARVVIWVTSPKHEAAK